ncbi:MAG: mercuric transporter MerT family protein, partial [Terriglobales bacterium]
MRDKAFIGASLVTAVGASLCCVLPIVFALAGAGIVGASAFFAVWRPYLLGVTFLLLGLGFYFAYGGRRQACEPGSACSVPAVSRSGRIGLWIATAVILVVAAFPYYSEAVAKLLLSESGDTPRASAVRLERASFAVEGMDCTACAAAIVKKLKALDGVQTATVSYEAKRAVVEFDANKVSVSQLQQAIQD